MVAAAAIIAQQLATYGDGDALWVPEPTDEFDVQLGDVGFITGDGAFNRLFNVMNPEDDPLNADGVPADFETLNINPRLLNVRPGHRAAVPLTSQSVTYKSMAGNLGA